MFRPPSEFRLQIVHRDTGLVVSWVPGDGIETDLGLDLANRLDAKGVGVLKTTAHVQADVRAALAEVIHDLKARV